jgi:WD40 repeat protein
VREAKASSSGQGTSRAGPQKAAASCQIEFSICTGHSLAGNSVAFSADGRTLASGSWKTIKLWEVATGRELRTLGGHSEAVNSVAFSADGKTLASGSYDNTVKLWEVATGRELRTLSGHSGSVNSVAFRIAAFPTNRNLNFEDSPLVVPTENPIRALNTCT